MDQPKFNISIPKDRLAEMPMVEFDQPITVVDTAEKARATLEKLSQCHIVGIDTETRPNFRKGQNHTVALVQISTADESFLFRICRTGFIDELRAFFENENVTKIGLSLKDDFHNLHKLAPFEPRGFIELQEFVRRFSISDASLQKIFGIIFGRRISKGQRLSNWEAEELSPAQRNYAAIDAWACLKIYNHLLAGTFVPEESPYIQLPDPETAPADAPAATD